MLVDEIRKAGLSEDVLLDNLAELVEQKKAEGQLGDSEIDVERVCHVNAKDSNLKILDLIKSAEERVKRVKQIQAEVPTCSGCFVKEGLNKSVS